LVATEGAKEGSPETSGDQRGTMLDSQKSARATITAPEDQEQRSHARSARTTDPGLRIPLGLISARRSLEDPAVHALHGHMVGHIAKPKPFPLQENHAQIF